MLSNTFSMARLFLAFSCNHDNRACSWNCLRCIYDKAHTSLPVNMSTYVYSYKGYISDSWGLLWFLHLWTNISKHIQTKQQITCQQGDKLLAKLKLGPKQLLCWIVLAWSTHIFFSSNVCHIINATRSKQTSRLLYWVFISCNFYNVCIYVRGNSTKQFLFIF